MRIVLPLARTRSEFAFSRMRFRSSGGDFFSQSGFGTTPNIAPPSSRNSPPLRNCTSSSPRNMRASAGNAALLQHLLGGVEVVLLALRNGLRQFGQARFPSGPAQNPFEKA